MLFSLQKTNNRNQVRDGNCVRFGTASASGRSTYSSIVFFFKNTAAGIICNAEVKLLGMTWNRPGLMRMGICTVLLWRPSLSLVWQKRFWLSHRRTDSKIHNEHTACQNQTKPGVSKKLTWQSFSHGQKDLLIPTVQSCQRLWIMPCQRRSTCTVFWNRVRQQLYGECGETVLCETEELAVFDIIEGSGSHCDDVYRYGDLLCERDKSGSVSYGTVPEWIWNCGTALVK